MSLINITDQAVSIVITDSGCYALGFYTKLPSGWCLFELAVWYRGQH